jgi:hypothetical protein
MSKTAVVKKIDPTINCAPIRLENITEVKVTDGNILVYCGSDIVGVYNASEYNITVSGGSSNESAHNTGSEFLTE